MIEQLAWSYADAGKRLGGISASTVRRMVQSGELISIKLRRKRVIPEESLQAFMEKQLRGASVIEMKCPTRKEKPRTGAPYGASATPRNTKATQSSSPLVQLVSRMQKE